MMIETMIGYWNRGIMDTIMRVFILYPYGYYMPLFKRSLIPTGSYQIDMHWY